MNDWERVRHSSVLFSQVSAPFDFFVVCTWADLPCHVALHISSWLSLLNPVAFSRIGENPLHIFGAISFLSIPIIRALYLEIANRTLTRGSELQRSILKR